MALELSTAGIKVKWAVETSAGTRPTTGYSVLPNVKSIPGYNPEPSNLQVTDLSDEVWHRYIPGLKDPGGSIGLTVNYNDTFLSGWNSLVSAYETAKEENKSLWIEFAIPDSESFYFSAIPSSLGFNGAEVDSVLENTAYLAPNGEPVWAAASTAGGATGGT